MVLKHCKTLEDVQITIEIAKEKMTVLTMFDSRKEEHVAAEAVMEQLDRRHYHVIFIPVDTVEMPCVAEKEGYKPNHEPCFIIYMRKKRVATIPCRNVKTMEETIRSMTKPELDKAIQRRLDERRTGFYE